MPNPQLLPYLTPEYLRGGSNIPELFPATDKTVQVEDGEIIILCDGSNAGEVFSARDGIVSSTMAVVKFDQRAIQRDFLFHYLKFYEPYLKAQTAGSGIPHLDKELLGLLPAIGQTEAAQIRIAAILTNLSQLINTTEAQLAKQQRLRTGLLRDLFTHGLDERGQLRSEETHEFKDSLLGRIPVEWEVKPLGRLGEVKGRVGWKGYTVADLRDSGALTLGAGNINKSNRLDLTDKVFLSAEKYLESPEIFVSKGDILIVQRGSIGKVCYIEEEIGEATINPSMVLLKNISGNASYIFTYLDSEGGQAQIAEATSQTGVPMISQAQVKAFLIPLPSDVEQVLLSEILAKESLLIQNTKQRLAKMRRLKTGLMQDLLTGRVPVGNLDSLLPEA